MNNQKPNLLLMGWRKAKELGDEEWTLHQLIVQKIQAYLASEEKILSCPDLIELLRQELHKRYQSDPELLAEHPEAIRKWQLKKNRNEAVWKSVRLTNLFTNEKKAEL